MNLRLFITEDCNNENVWFARTIDKQYARLKLKDIWEVYFYEEKFTVRLPTLKRCLELIEKMFKEKYEK